MGGKLQYLYKTSQEPPSTISLHEEATILFGTKLHSSLGILESEAIQLTHPNNRDSFRNLAKQLETSFSFYPFF
jgi:hypothetical protein